MRVSGLETGYDGTTVLRDVSLTVPAGEVTALLGPNGAGKTTLLRAVSGFLPASKGSITLFGEDVTEAAAHRRFAAGLCHVPEGRGIFRSLTVRENLVMQARKGEEGEAIERADVGLPDPGRADGPGRRHAQRRPAADAGDGCGVCAQPASGPGG